MDEKSYSSSEEEPEEKPQESLNEIVQKHNLELVNLQKSLNSLFKEFDELAQIAYTAKQDAGDYFEIDYIDDETKERFIAWDKNFQATIGEAENLGAIEKGFLDKYQNYTAEEWANDPFWREIQGHYQTIGINEASVNALENIIEEIEDSQKERYEGYEKVGKHPASIVLTVGILPLIILAIYGLDRAINGIRLAINEYQKSSSEKEVVKAKAALETHGSPIQREAHYQAAIGAKPFFEPLKQAAKEEAEKTADPSSTKSPKFGNTTDSDID